LRSLGVDVTAVELKRKILPLILDSTAAEYAKQQFEKNGVEVRTGTSLKTLRPLSGSRHPYAAVTSGDDEIRFDFLVLATGMKPNLSLIAGTSIKQDKGIIVAQDMRTSAPGIYAAGDITEYDNWIENRPEIHAHWVNAHRQGRIAGLHMAGKESASYEPVYLNSLDVFGLPIITMGESRVDNPRGATVYVMDVPSRPAYRRFVLKEGRLTGATFLNDVSRAGVVQYLMREKLHIGDIAESLFEEKLDALEFLYKHHEKAVKGNVDWPASMDLIDRYQKDHSHTRWGEKDKS
ncbi:MAG: FAD-dependent oxidoreductase, partial [Candidatus Latescibacterota bacterium]